MAIWVLSCGLRWARWNGLVEMQDVLAQSLLDVEALLPKKGGRRKTVASVKVIVARDGGLAPRSAGEVVGYGAVRGWVRGMPEMMNVP